MARNKEIERDILEQAIQAVGQETGLRLHIEKWDARVDHQPVDAIIRFEPVDLTLGVRIKNWAQHTNLGALIHQIEQIPRGGLLAADYVNPRMADRLRHQGVQFIDTAGNAYIDHPPVYIFVTGKRPKTRAVMSTKGGARRAFEPKGLVVIFAFLCHPELVDAPYREIAARTGVAIGTVGWVLNGLKAAGFMHNGGARKGRRLVHCRKLLERWVEAYPEKLQPKQQVGQFIADDPYWWKKIDIRRYDGCWGGEIAAARYTNYLKPKVATLYLPEPTRTRLLRDARLRKATEGVEERAGSVHIYRPFWLQPPEASDDECQDGLVHPILVYADLVATAEPRNLEAARKINDQYIAQYCRED